MKEWRGNDQRQELRLSGEPVCVLYYDEAFGYWCNAQLDGGSHDEAFGKCSLEQARKNTEVWYAAQMRLRYGMHRRIADGYMDQLKELEGEDAV